MPIPCARAPSSSRAFFASVSGSSPSADGGSTRSGRSYSRSNCAFRPADTTSPVKNRCSTTRFSVLQSHHVPRLRRTERPSDTNRSWICEADSGPSAATRLRTSLTCGASGSRTPSSSRQSYSSANHRRRKASSGQACGGT